MFYLGEHQLLPFDRLAGIMRDLFACGIFSEGTLANFKTGCSRRLEPVEATIRDLATAAPVAGCARNPVAAPHGPKRRGRRKQSKGRNLFDRFRNHPDSVLAFVRDFALPSRGAPPVESAHGGNPGGARDQLFRAASA